MARNGSGTYTLPSGNPVVTGATISSTTHNTTMTDIETALTASIAKDGQTVWTGNQDMNGGKIILDADADTSITADTDDQIDIEVGGTDALILGHQKIADGSFIDIDPAAVTLNADESYHKVRVNGSAAITVPTGTTAIVSTMSLTEPNIVATGTVTTAATLHIASAPTEGASNYALWVDSGKAKFDDTTGSGISAAFGLITSATTTDGVGIASVSSSGTGLYELVFDVAATGTDKQCCTTAGDDSQYVCNAENVSTTSIRIEQTLTGTAFNHYPISFARYLF